MTMRTNYYVNCDACGENVGWSHDAKTAREEAKRASWVRRKNKAGEPIDVCAKCHQLGNWQHL